MKILVSLHDLAFGGTTVNAIELAASLRDNHGHDVVLFASPGPMIKLVTDAGLRYIPAPLAQRQPSPARMQALRATVRSERPDLVHAWETSPCLDAYCAVHLPWGLPMLVTDMQMQLTRILPKGLVTTFGIPALVDQAKATGRRNAELLLPPVDIQRNAPGSVDPTTFRGFCGLAASDITLVTVSRLVDSLKGESLIRTIEAVGRLGHDLPLRLVIVGDGTARAKITKLAESVNTQLSRAAVVLAGAMVDPRPAYAAADIVIGMGGSALRAMAFGKPTIVVGELGFSAPLTPDTAEDFLYKGLYGVASGNMDCAALAEDVRVLLESAERLPALGEFSRQWVAQHFALDIVGARLSALCSAAASNPPRFPIATTDALRTAAIYLRERRFLWRIDSAQPLNHVDALAHVEG